MKNLFSALVLSGTTFFVHAQDTTPAQSYYKHDLGFNTNFVFQGLLNSGSTPFSVMYKTYTSEHKATRFGLSISAGVNKNNTAGGNTGYYSNGQQVNLSFNLGREFQVALPKNWTFYYGGDLQPLYSLYNRDDFQSYAKYYSHRYWYAGLGLRPFLGMRYNVSERLYVAAEAGLTLNYTYSKTQDRNLPQNAPATENDTHGYSFALNTQSAYGIFLFYRF